MDNLTQNITEQTTTNDQATPSALVGKWFFTFKDNNDVDWQGTILSLVDSETYLVQLFSWIAGEPLEQYLINRSAMKSWGFYDTKDDHEFAWQYRFRDRQSYNRPQSEDAK